MDVDGSGSVEFPEFCVMMVKKMRESDIENEVSTKKNKILLFFSGGGGVMWFIVLLFGTSYNLKYFRPSCEIRGELSRLFKLLRASDHKKKIISCIKLSPLCNI